MKQEVQEATLMPNIVYSYVPFIRLLSFMIKFYSGRSSCRVFRSEKSLSRLEFRHVYDFHSRPLRYMYPLELLRSTGMSFENITYSNRPHSVAQLARH